MNVVEVFLEYEITSFKQIILTFFTLYCTILELGPIRVLWKQSECISVGSKNKVERRK